MDHSRDPDGDSQGSQSHTSDRFAGAFSGARRASSSHSTKRSPGDGSQPANTPGSHSGPDSPSFNSSAAGAAASTSASTNSPSVAGLNPRSCITCRRRKVKCDKRQPCSNCLRASIDCVFPGPGRAPRKAKKPPDAELLARLRHLEGVVQKLGKTLPGDEASGAAADGASEASDDKRPESAIEIPDDPPSLSNPKHNPRLGDTSASAFNGRLRIEKEMGKLVVGEGKSRYVSNTFWASLTEEVAEMRDMIGDPSDSDTEEDDQKSPESMESGSSNSKQTHQEFLFGYSSTMISLRILHPPGKQIMTYWDLFVENVDPMVRILHRPTARHLFATAARNQGDLSRSAEALVFAVYFGVVISLSPEKCQQQLGLDRTIALKRFRFATEQALSRAGFLATQELIVVQAFCLFLSCVRRHDETKTVWTMTGMLMRTATSIGLHRDGTHFNLPPFQTEMRRRLWYQICTLDVRSSEDQGSDPLTAYSFYDTRMPLNINDSDIWPDMKEPPTEHVGCTEMTFDLVRYEIGGTVRLLSASQSSHRLPEAQAFASLEAMEQLLERLRHRLENRYLRHCDMSVPLQWVAAIVARLVMAKIWLVIHHPFRRIMGSSRSSEETRNRTFLTSIDVIRYSRMLETQYKTSKWGWMFRTYFQWHAVAFLLSELCTRTTGTAVDEAWEVLAEAFPDWDRIKSTHRHGMLWKPIQKLIARAKAIRIAELHRRRVAPQDGSKDAPSSESFLAAAKAHVAATELIDLQGCRASANLATTATPFCPPPSTSNQVAQQSPPAWPPVSPANSGSGASNSMFSPPQQSTSGLTMPRGFGANDSTNLDDGSNQAAFADMLDMDLGTGVGAGLSLELNSMGMLRSGSGVQDGLQANPTDGPTNRPYGQLFLDDPFLQDNSTWDLAGSDAPWADVMAGLEGTDDTLDPAQLGAQGMASFGGPMPRFDGTGDIRMWGESAGF